MAADSEHNFHSAINKLFFLSSSLLKWRVRFLFFSTGWTKPLTIGSFLSVFLISVGWARCWRCTLTDGVRMDHTTLQSINTSMRNAWFLFQLQEAVYCSILLPAAPSLSWFTGDVPALYCTQTAVKNATQAYCTVNSRIINIAMLCVLMNHLCSLEAGLTL